jgi:tight adherence protein C
VTCIDLLGVAATSGQTVPDAVRSVGAVGTGPLAAELAAVARALERGAPLAGRLEDLADRTGPEVRALVSTLQVALRSGDGAGPALQRLADAERRRERRRRETRLRRLPVLLTIPLVLFVLPAFVVLTLVPVTLSVAGDLPGLAVAAVPTGRLVPLRTVDRSPS